METYTFGQYQESAKVLRERLGSFTPKVLLILGSGLGALGDEVQDPIAVLPIAMLVMLLRNFLDRKSVV